MTGESSSWNMRGVLLTLFAALFACTLITGCAGGNLGKADGHQETAESEQSASEDKRTDDEEAASKKKLTTAEAREAALRDFIDSYNATASTPFVLNEYFDPKDKGGAHYRTEYRLSAWTDGKGASGTTGEINVDFVSYRDGVRMYASLKGVDLDGRAALLRDALGAYVGDLDSSAIAAFVEEYRDDGNKELSGSDLMLFDKRLNGYILSSEMMLEVK